MQISNKKRFADMQKNLKIYDKNFSNQKSFNYSYTVFKVKRSKRSSTEDIDLHR